MKISIIIPAYNEEERISPTIKSIVSYFNELGETYEVIVVDDGSKDRTRQVVVGLNIPEVRLVSYEKNGGKGFAVNYGVKQARGEHILFTDADNSTPIKEFSAFWKEVSSNTIIIGSRYLPESNITVKQSLPRRVASRIGNLLIQSLILPGIRDTQCGFKLFPKNIAKVIFEKQTIYGWGFDMEILRIAKEHGYKIKELPVTWHNDDQSKIQSSNVFTKTFKELLVIKINSLSGEYKEKKNPSEVRRIIKFAFVGAIGTLIDFGVLNILHVSLSVNLYIAVSLGFIAGATNNYIFNSLWSFRHLLTWKKFSSYLWISIVGLALSNIIIFLVIDNLSWNHNAAKLVAVAIVFIWNYVMNRQLTFKN